VNLELRENPLRVIPDGGRRDPELPRDRRRSHPEREKLQDLFLPSRQLPFRGGEATRFLRAPGWERHDAVSAP